MFRIVALIALVWLLYSRASTDFFGLAGPPPSIDLENTYVDALQSGDRLWRAPDFSNQRQALGYSPGLFKVPRTMEKQVQFWVDIYSRYDSKQGVIHDSEWLDVIYEVVDFSGIEMDSRLDRKQKEILKEKKVEEAKDRIRQALHRLDRLGPAALGSPLEDQIWQSMKSIHDREKFKKAARGNRIRFQLGQSDRMKKAIYISGRYIEDFEEIFRKEKLPIELTRLVFVESSFNVLARSKVGASGLWQIMPSVAKPRKMINPYVDRRNDPWDATLLAAKVLRNNYQMLKDWPLAITGYNRGPYGVKRLLSRYKAGSLVNLLENPKTRRHFGFASRNFYASFLAALEVEKNADRYFPDIKWSEKLEVLPLRISSATEYKNLVEVFGNDKTKADLLNPHITSQAKKLGARIPAGTKIYVPADKIDYFESSESVRKVAVESGSEETSSLLSR